MVFCVEEYLYTLSNISKNNINYTIMLKRQDGRFIHNYISI